MIEHMLPKIKHMPTLLNAEMLLRAKSENYQIKQVSVVHQERKFGISRGLPWKTFALESCYAYLGLLKIKKEYSKSVSWKGFPLKQAFKAWVKTKLAS